MTPTQRREAVEFICRKFKVSERKACRILGQARSTQRYTLRERDDEAKLKKRILKLSVKHPRYGVRRITALLRREGRIVNEKRVSRLRKKLGLQCKKRRKRKAKRGYLGRSANSCMARPSTKPNDVWAWDFIESRMIDGGKIRWLTLIDEYTRECLLLVPDRSLTGPKVVRELAKAVGRYGEPVAIRSDNGPEFISEAIQDWLKTKQIKTLYIKPGSPWENGFEESFHSRLREEFLNESRFASMGEAKVKAQVWRRNYNCRRPHSGIDYQTPREVRERFLEGGQGPLS